MLVKDIHVYSGLLLPGPAARSPTPAAGATACGATSAGFARWSTDDRRWLRSLGRRGEARLGKFNAGQKLNAIFVAGCIPLMLATGGIMRWFDPFPLAWRTGATFVHDWIALALLVVVVGHIGKALAEPVAAAGDGPRHGARRATSSGATPAGGPRCRSRPTVRPPIRVTAAPNEEIPWTSASA